MSTPSHPNLQQDTRTIPQQQQRLIVAQCDVSEADTTQRKSNSTEVPVTNFVDSAEESGITSVETDSTANSTVNTSAASAIDGGRQVSNKILYVGNLHKSIDEPALTSKFSSFGAIKLVKILNDKNKSGFNYAFVEFYDPKCASAAKAALSGGLIGDHSMLIKWAYHSSNANSVQSTEPVFNVFVGDLSPEVDDEALRNAFAHFGSLREAHVMWDMQTSRSRGYGFVTFLDQNDAQTALSTMNGKRICGRVVRCNWASHKLLNGSKRSRRSSGVMVSVAQGQFLLSTPLQLGPVPGTHGSPMIQIPIQLLQMNSMSLGGLDHMNSVGAINGSRSALPTAAAHPLLGQVPAMKNAGGAASTSGAGVTLVAVPGRGSEMVSSASSIISSSGETSTASSADVRGDTSGNTSTTTSNAPLDPVPANLVVGFDQLSVHDKYQYSDPYDPLKLSDKLSLVSLNTALSQLYEIVARQTPSWHSTVYLGNIAHFTQQAELIPLVQSFGYLVDFKYHPEKGCAFAKYDSHERAALAIVQLAGFQLNGRPLKCGWGKGKPPYRNMFLQYSR